MPEASPNPSFPTEMLAEIAFAHFGIRGRVEPLTSERDQNAAIFVESGEAFVLKLANAAEDPAVLRLQNAALAAAASYRPALPVPRVLASRAGRDLEFVERDGRRHALRLLTRLPGRPLSRLPGSPALRRDLGTVAAHLDQALAGLDAAGRHQQLRHHLPWDMSRALEIRPLLPLLSEEDHRRLLTAVLDDAAAATLPGLAALPQQWIHNDLNLNNLLAEPEQPDRISGVIDFGDVLRAPRACEVAIAATHQCVREADPLAAALEVVSAYHAVSPLQPLEIHLLPRLMALRLAMAVLIQLSHTAEKGGGHFDLAMHGAFLRVVARLAAIGWEDSAARMQDALRDGGKA